jgi:hypothetical protein
LAEPSDLFSYTPQSSPNLMSPALATSSFNRDTTRICPPWASSAFRVVRITFLARKSPIVWTLMRALTGSAGCSRLWAANSPQRLRPQYLTPGKHPLHEGPHAQLLGDSQGFVQQAVDGPLNSLACHYRGILASHRRHFTSPFNHTFFLCIVEVWQRFVGEWATSSEVLIFTT